MGGARTALLCGLIWLLIPESGWANDAAPTDDGKVIKLGKIRYKSYYLVGINTIGPDKRLGGISMYRLKRTTNFTFYDLQIYTYLVPRFGPAAPIDGRNFAYFGRARLKRSEKSFDFPWFYDWSTYEVKTSSEEDLDLRATLASGYGAFLVRPKGGKRDASVIAEAGFVVDYASLNAYTDNISNGYVWNALEFDFQWDSLSGKVLNHLYSQVTSPHESFPDQSRYDFEGRLSVHVYSNLKLSAGLLHLRFLFPRMAMPGRPVPHSSTTTAYTAVTWTH